MLAKRRRLIEIPFNGLRLSLISSLSSSFYHSVALLYNLFHQHSLRWLVHRLEPLKNKHVCEKFKPTHKCKHIDTHARSLAGLIESSRWRELEGSIEMCLLSTCCPVDWRKAAVGAFSTGRTVCSMTTGESNDEELNERPAACSHMDSSTSYASSCATSSVAASPSGNCSFFAFFFPFGVSVNCSQSRLWRRMEPFSATIWGSSLPRWPRLKT